jgi:high-affinity Fe2+/Pb2+ permease
VVDAVHSASVAAVGRRDIRTRSTPLIRAWWAAWVVSNIFGFMISAAGRNRALAAQVSAAGCVVAAVLAILVIRTITRAQARKVAALTGPLDN